MICLKAYSNPQGCSPRDNTLFVQALALRCSGDMHRGWTWAKSLLQHNLAQKLLGEWKFLLHYAARLSIQQTVMLRCITATSCKDTMQVSRREVCSFHTQARLTGMQTAWAGGCLFLQIPSDTRTKDVGLRACSAVTWMTLGCAHLPARRQRLLQHISRIKPCPPCRDIQVVAYQHQLHLMCKQHRRCALQ